jgi:hypothetical protein
MRALRAILCFVLFVFFVANNFSFRVLRVLRGSA